MGICLPWYGGSVSGMHPFIIDFLVTFYLFIYMTLAKPYTISCYDLWMKLSNLWHEKRNLTTTFQTKQIQLTIKVLLQQNYQYLIMYILYDEYKLNL